MVLNKKITVLQVLPDLNSGGVEKGTLEVNKYLTKKGHRSIVISNGGRMVDELINDNGEHYKLAVGKKTFLTLFTIPKLISLIKINKIDVVHARSRLPAWVCYFALRFVEKNIRPAFITTFHGAYSVNKYSSIMAKGDMVIVVSNTIKKYVLKNYKVDKKKLFLNYRGVSKKEFSPKFTASREWLIKWYEEFPQTKEKIILTIPGRITRIKGQDHFIQVIDKIVKKYPNIHGLIMGEEKSKSKYMRELTDKVKSLNLDANITFVGHRKDAKQIMSISRLVFSLTKVPEAFGRISLESLSLGVPVIAYSHGGVKEQLSEILPEGLVSVGNINNVAKLACKWINKSPVIKRNHYFTLEKMLENTLKIYKKMLIELKK
jgi:glycosyltransferase involved in cell wall biosynthesis